MKNFIYMLTDKIESLFYFEYLQSNLSLRSGLVIIFTSFLSWFLISSSILLSISVKMEKQADSQTSRFSSDMNFEQISDVFSKDASNMVIKKNTISLKNWKDEDVDGYIRDKNPQFIRWCRQEASMTVLIVCIMQLILGRTPDLSIAEMIKFAVYNLRDPNDVKRSIYQACLEMEKADNQEGSEGDPPVLQNDEGQNLMESPYSGNLVSRLPSDHVDMKGFMDSLPESLTISGKIQIVSETESVKLNDPEKVKEFFKFLASGSEKAQTLALFFCCFLMRTCIKSPDSMANAFYTSFKKSYNSLYSSHQVDHELPILGNEFFEKIGTSFNKGTPLVTECFAIFTKCLIILSNRRESKDKADVAYVKSMLSTLNAACMTHTSGNGLALPSLFNRIMNEYEISTKELFECVLSSSTRTGVLDLYEFTREYMTVNAESKGWMWSRIIDDDYFQSMRAQSHPVLVLRLAGILVPDIEDGLWSMNCFENVPQEDIRECVRFGLKVRDRFKKKVIDSEGTALYKEIISSNPNNPPSIVKKVPPPEDVDFSSSDEDPNEQDIGVGNDPIDA